MTSTRKIADALLVLDYRSGNKKALSALVKRWHPRLCRQAFWHTGDIDLAKDIAQESWKTILFKLHTLKDPHCFGNWALTLVNRKALDWLRKNKNRKEQCSDLPDFTADTPEEVRAENDETSRRIKILKQAIKQLPAPQQMVLHLFYVEEYSLQEIGGILNIAPGTVKSRLFYAREKLKTLITSKNP